MSLGAVLDNLSNAGKYPLSARIKSLTVFGSVALCIGPNKFSLFVYFGSIVVISLMSDVPASLLISLPIALCLPDTPLL